MISYAESNCPPSTALLPTLYLASGSSPSTPSLPLPGPYWSLMFEISSSSTYKPVLGSPSEIIARTLQGALAVNLLEGTDEIVSTHIKFLERGYPTPHVDRDAVLKEALPLLRDTYGIWSRGRFGAWK